MEHFGQKYIIWRPERWLSLPFRASSLPVIPRESVLIPAVVQNMESLAASVQNKGKNSCLHYF